MMRPKTTTALAVAAALLAVPAAQREAEIPCDIPGRPRTVAAQMRPRRATSAGTTSRAARSGSPAASPPTTASASTPRPSAAACAA